MAFSVPTFNLTCNIFTVVLPATLTFRLDSPCNLAMGRRINWPWSEGDVGLGADGYTPALLLPALTDVRSAVQGVENDVIEVPAGSGRWYNVAGVDDVGKGFDNEYRIVSLRQISHFRDWIPLGIPYWPIPMP